MIDSKIQWCHDTVNVVEGCEQVDSDCKNCFAKAIAARFAQDQVTARRESDGAPMETKPGHYSGLARLSPGRRLPQWTGEVRLRSDVLDAWFWRLLRAREPRRQFLCSMGDIFHREVPDAFLDEVFARIAILESRRPASCTIVEADSAHPAYMLTKRPERAAVYTNAPGVEERIERAARSFIAIERSKPSAGAYRRAIASLVGEDARPCELAWMDVVAEDCRREGAPLFVKQLGNDLARRLGREGKGGKLEDLPEHLRIRQFPRIPARTAT